MKKLFTNVITGSLLVALCGCSSGGDRQTVTLTDDDFDARLGMAPTWQDAQPFPGGMYTREPWRFSGFEGALLKTPKYRIYTTLEYPELIDRLPHFFEEMLKHYVTSITPLPMPDQPLETFLFQQRRQWKTKTQQMLPDQADVFMNLGRGGFTTRGTSVLYYIDRWGASHDTLAIAAHEGWHQYTQKTFRHQLPVWLEEGVATYMEGFFTRDNDEVVFDPAANRERRLTLRLAVKYDDLIELKALLTRTPQAFLSESKDKLLIYYSQVWALTRFLADGEEGKYNSALQELLNDAAEGKLVGRMGSSPAMKNKLHRVAGISNRLGTAVVLEYFNSDFDEFEKQYLAYIDELLEHRKR